MLRVSDIRSTDQLVGCFQPIMRCRILSINCQCAVWTSYDVNCAALYLGLTLSSDRKTYDYDKMLYYQVIYMADDWIDCGKLGREQE
jgi:hypothetical protein